MYYKKIKHFLDPKFCSIFTAYSLPHMIKKIELDFGTIYVYDKILVSELNEGVLLDVLNNRKILEIGKETFLDAPFGYISNRVNSYAVNPMVYRESAEHPQLKAIAVVSKNEMGRKSALLEQQFFTNRNSFQIFSDLEEAKRWMSHIVSSYSKKDSLNL